MAKPTMNDFAVMPRKLEEVAPAATPKAQTIIPSSPAKVASPAHTEAKPAAAQEKKTEKSPSSDETDSDKRDYKRKRKSAKKRGYESHGFILKEEYYQRFADLRQAFKEEHGEDAGIVLINEALELLFAKHQAALQEHYARKLSGIQSKT